MKVIEKWAHSLLISELCQFLNYTQYKVATIFNVMDFIIGSFRRKELLKMIGKRWDNRVTVLVSEVLAMEWDSMGHD